MRKMDLNRFEALVAAYGAAPNRWPEDERDAAQAFAQSDARAAALLAEADSIDAMLFAHRVAEPSRTLRAMVIEGAPTKRQRLKGRARLWWSGLALTLAGASGAFAGSAATAALDVTSNIQMYAQDEVPALDYQAEENAQ